jgi:hypothetical protein
LLLSNTDSGNPFDNRLAFRVARQELKNDLARSLLSTSWQVAVADSELHILLPDSRVDARASDASTHACTECLNSFAGTSTHAATQSAYATGHAWEFRELGKWRGLITIRWALVFTLLVMLVFALTTGYRLGAEYVEQLLAR